MALTAEVEQRLQAAGLIDFLDSNRPLFKDMAAEAFSYASKYVTAAKLPIRIDDVAIALEPALKVSVPLEKFLATKRLTQKYWFRYFADLVLDRLWKELATHDTV